MPKKKKGGKKKGVGNTNNNAVDNLNDDAIRPAENKLGKLAGKATNNDETFGGAEKEGEGQEVSQSGVVRLETYLNYLRAAGGLWIGVAMIALFSVTQAAVLLTIATVGRWAERPSEEQVSIEYYQNRLIEFGAISSLIFVFFQRTHGTYWVW